MTLNCDDSGSSMHDELCNTKWLHAGGCAQAELAVMLEANIQPCYSPQGLSKIMQLGCTPYTTWNHHTSVPQRLCPFQPKLEVQSRSGRAQCLVELIQRRQTC
jgi:hypothetical protein